MQTFRESSSRGVVISNSELDNTGVHHNEKESRIRYRVELRNRLNNELLRRQDTRRLGIEDLDKDGNEQPAFEVITTFMTTVLENTRERISEINMPAPSGLARPSYHIRIFSPAIIYALHSVVQYYPSQDLSGDFISINWPYPVLVHHYRQLADFREKCANKDASELCMKEMDAQEHLGLLLNFLDEHVMSEVREEEERNKRGFYTYEYAWVHYKPGTTWLCTIREDDDWHARVIHSITGGTFVDPPDEWHITYWNLQYDGEYLGRVSTVLDDGKFDGETPLDDILVQGSDLTEENLENLPEPIAKQLEYGKKYWNLVRKQCRHHKGRSRDFPFNEVEGLVMLDLKAYYTNFKYGRPHLMDLKDCRGYASECSCAVCQNQKAHSEKRITSPFEDYNAITRDELTLHHYLLCPFEMKAFVFSTRTWEMLHVDNCLEPRFDENIIDRLVMNEERKEILKKLAKRFARQNKNGDVVDREIWSADFVSGKGSGLIFLLHGKPGTGKTCTAESIAAFAKRPLMVLTSSDIGTDPATVEVNLTANFRAAKSWNAILVIDEADVFMERRTTTDLLRNSLVAGFLRALEHYDGILFLTTNRVGSFDDAFISRIHMQLYYPDFTDDQRQQIWQTFADKLATERGDYIRLNIDAKEYLRGSKIRSLKWNGRAIRNAFQTAVTLAEYDDERDQEGKILVTDAHLRSVVGLSQDFNHYLDELHKGDESKRAERKYERLDTFTELSKGH